MNEKLHVYSNHHYKYNGIRLSNRTEREKLLCTACTCDGSLSQGEPLLISHAVSASPMAGKGKTAGGNSGGGRRGSGLKPGHWEMQGGRKAAAEAKAQRAAAEKVADEERKRKAREQWKEWAAPAAKQQKASASAAAAEQSESSNP